MRFVIYRPWNLLVGLFEEVGRGGEIDGSYLECGVCLYVRIVI
jgi:hypothetical protein